MSPRKTALLIACTTAALGCAFVVSMMPAVPEPVIVTLYFQNDQGLVRHTCKQITMRYGLFATAEVDAHLAEVKVEPGTPEYEPGLLAAKNRDRILTGPLPAGGAPLTQAVVNLPGNTR